MKNIISLDVGTTKVGIAYFNKKENVVRGLGTIFYEKNDFKFLINKINEIIKEYDVKKIIVGNPKDYVTSDSYICKYIQKFFIFLKNNDANVLVEMFNEHSSSYISKKKLNIMYNNKQTISKYIDIESAKIILRDYLNLRKTHSNLGNNYGK